MAVIPGKQAPVGIRDGDDRRVGDDVLDDLSRLANLRDLAAEGAAREGVHREAPDHALPEPPDVGLVHRRLDLHPCEVLRDREERRCLETRRHRLARVDGPRHDHAVDRGADLRVDEVQPSLFERSLLLTDVRSPYDTPAEQRCGECSLCLTSLPDGRVSRAGRRRRAPLRLLPEHRESGRRAEPLRLAGFAGRIFGCDVCQAVCCGTAGRSPRGMRVLTPRPLAALPPAEVAALTPEQWDQLAPGMAVARARYDGLRRNALYAIGSARDRGARDVVVRLAEDPVAVVRDAAGWALERLDDP